MTPEARSAYEWACQQYAERPPQPLTAQQERAIALLGKVTPSPVPLSSAA